MEYWSREDEPVPKSAGLQDVYKRQPWNSPRFRVGFSSCGGVSPHLLLMQETVQDRLRNPQDAITPLVTGFGRAEINHARFVLEVTDDTRSAALVTGNLPSPSHWTV